MNLKRTLQQLRYFGSRVYCPICDHRFRAFGPFGYNPRPNAQCLHCGAVERHRLVWLFLKRFVFPGYNYSNARFLHLAPEKCIQDRVEKQFAGDYILGDIDLTHIAPSSFATVSRVDILALPFANRSLDLIYCSHVLEHVEDDYQAMREIFRVLKDDGCAIVLVPQIQAMRHTYEDPCIKDPELQAKLYGQPGHVRRYGIDFVDRLRSVGFLARGIRPEEFVPEEDIEKMVLRMGKVSEQVYVCLRTERNRLAHPFDKDVAKSAGE